MPLLTELVAFYVAVAIKISLLRSCFFKRASAERVYRFGVPPRLLTFASTFSKMAHASGTLNASVPHR
jgi:hypothetical protein